MTEPAEDLIVGGKGGGASTSSNAIIYYNLLPRLEKV